MTVICTDVTCCMVLLIKCQPVVLSAYWHTISAIKFFDVFRNVSKIDVCGTDVCGVDIYLVNQSKAIFKSLSYALERFFCVSEIASCVLAS